MSEMSDMSDAAWKNHIVGAHYGFVLKLYWAFLEISRTALAAGFSAIQPGASALRLIVLKQSLVRVGLTSSAGDLLNPERNRRKDATPNSDPL